MQRDIDKLYDWSVKWKLSFNPKKCKVLHIGKSNSGHVYKLSNCDISKTESEVDLGVQINANWNFNTHIASIINKSNAVLGQIRRSFKCRSPELMGKLFKQYVRPKLEYCTPIWSPHTKYNIDAIEKVQSRLLNMIPQLKSLPYEDKLKVCGLELMKDRRHKFDLILAHNIIYKSNQCDEFFSFSQSRDRNMTRSYERNDLVIPKYSTSF